MAKRTYIVVIKGNDVFHISISVSAESFREALSNALNHIAPLESLTIEQLRIASIQESDQL